MDKLIHEKLDRFNRKLVLDKKGISFEGNYTPSIELNVEDTMYNTFLNTVEKNPNAMCITDWIKDKRYTRKEVLDMIDDFAGALYLDGVRQGDIIALPVKNSVEAFVALIAANKIGAITKWIDIEKSACEISDSFKESDVKYVIAEKLIEDKINKIDDINRDKLLIIDSENDSKNSEFNKFLNRGKNVNIGPIKYDKNMPALIISSSGSTGKPKNMLHSSFSVNSAVKKLLYTDYPITNNLVTVSVPPYIGLGLVTSFYSSIICEGEALILPEYKNPGCFASFLLKNYTKIRDMIGDRKILLFGAPVFYKVLASELDKLPSLDFIGGMVAAGNKMTKEELTALDSAYKLKGCNVPICNAYGQNEHCGGVTYNMINDNKQGSAGKIAYATRVMIVDPETKEQLPLNETGKVLEQSDSQFIGYYKNPEAEEKCKFIDSDGEEWFDTGDLGSIDEDHFLHIFDRESRSIIRFDFKIALASVENKLLRSSKVKDALVVRVNVDTPMGKDQAPFAFVTLKDNCDATSEDILNEIQSGDYPLSIFENPVAIEIIKENQIPYNNNKVHYPTLENVAQQLIDNAENTNNIDNQKKKVKE